MNCLVCSSELDKNNKIELFKGYAYVVCYVCGMAVLHPNDYKTITVKKYQGEKYYSDLSKPLKNNLLQWLLTRKIYSGPADWVAKILSPRKILDVGCGNGEFLSAMQKYGWRVNGADISAIAAKRTEERIGKNMVKYGDFLKLKLDKVDVVSFWHVLEHVPSPLDYVKKAKEVLSKDGIIIGEVPNFDTPYIRIFRSNYSWLMIPEHNLYFSKSALKRLLTSAGFSSIEIYSPPRSLLNLMLSINKMLIANKVNKFIRYIVMLFSFLPSVIVGSLLALIDRGEVIRFKARKVTNV